MSRISLDKKRLKLPNAFYQQNTKELAPSQVQANNVVARSNEFRMIDLSVETANG